MSKKNWCPCPVDFAWKFSYCEVVGSRLFITVCTRDDIAFQVDFLSRFLSNSSKSAFLAAKRALLYLYNTKGRKLVLGGSNRPLLKLFYDTDWESCVLTRKSAEGYMLFCGNGQRKDQSMAEAEYCCLTPSISQVRWVWSLLHELGVG